MIRYSLAVGLMVTTFSHSSFAQTPPGVTREEVRAMIIEELKGVQGEVTSIRSDMGGMRTDTRNQLLEILGALRSVPQSEAPTPGATTPAPTPSTQSEVIVPTPPVTQVAPSTKLAPEVDTSQGRPSSPTIRTPASAPMVKTIPPSAAPTSQSMLVRADRLVAAPPAVLAPRADYLPPGR